MTVNFEVGKYLQHIYRFFYMISSLTKMIEVISFRVYLYILPLTPRTFLGRGGLFTFRLKALLCVIPTNDLVSSLQMTLGKCIRTPKLFLAVSGD